jgi:ABC-2 type transport system ATP-binding protein
VAGLRKKFGRVMAVDDVSFTVSAGRITGFLGPNGAGKTTTLRMVLGLIRADAGTAVIAGKPYAQLTNPARTVGALLDAAAAHPGRSGRDHLRVLATQAGIPGRRAGQLLDRVGLAVDDVVVISHGRTITQAPLVELLAGRPGSTLEDIYPELTGSAEGELS